ncbi:MAG: hypothetical protein CR972_00245 [Candidatus Moraniibacteriota bacterium]|nr:MAG: hypothetical protein CR972_00245 [Candidatus Moranbacteria bacterium]
MNFYHVIKKEAGTILIAMIAIATVLFFISAFMTSKYHAEIKVLIVQKNYVIEEDFYNSNRMSNYVGKVFSRVIYTDAFLNQVLQSPLNIRKTFSMDSRERKKEWGEMVSVDRLGDVGIVRVSVFDVEEDVAVNTAKAIAWAMSKKKNEYFSDAENLDIRIIDEPIVHDIKTRPNIYVNTIFGLLIGLVGSIGYIFFLKDK